MNSSPILGVIFDMDGVLVDSEPFICEAACRMFAQVHGLTVQPGDFKPFVGTGEDRFIGGVAEKYGLLKRDAVADKATTYRIYLEIIKGRLAPLPGVVEFVKYLRQRGITTAVASSADLIKVKGNLTEIGLAPEANFDAVVCGEDVVHKKPAPDIFQLAARRIGLGNAECIVVEDAPSGVQAAKAAGSRCLGILSSFDEQTLRVAGADWIAKDLSSAKDLLQL
jgi:HAD superfamily hydrolase (TIGR01509 family)